MGKTTHGMHKTKTYSSWVSMKSRCLNKNNSGYKKYGGAGITVCDKWMTFEGFLSDMGKRPEGKTLDREDGKKGYSKDNCRWATYSEQNYNRRTQRNNAVGAKYVSKHKSSGLWRVVYGGRDNRAEKYFKTMEAAIATAKAIQELK